MVQVPNGYGKIIDKRGVAQLVARVVRDDEAAGSNPVTPTFPWIRLRSGNLVLFLMTSNSAHPNKVQYER